MHEGFANEKPTDGTGDIKNLRWRAKSYTKLRDARKKGKKVVQSN